MIEKAIHLLNNQVCSSCKFSHKYTSVIVTMMGIKAPKDRTCNYDMQHLKGPRIPEINTELPLLKIVNDNDFCDKWEGI